MITFSTVSEAVVLASLRATLEPATDFGNFVGIAFDSTTCDGTAAPAVPGALLDLAATPFALGGKEATTSGKVSIHDFDMSS